MTNPEVQPTHDVGKDLLLFVLMSDALCPTNSRVRAVRINPAAAKFLIPEANRVGLNLNGKSVPLNSTKFRINGVIVVVTKRLSGEDVRAEVVYAGA